MNKLVFNDIRSETVRQDIISHLRKEAAVQQAHMNMGTKRAKERSKRAWRKVLSDVDDTLTCSGGSYPAGVDKRFGKKVVYPGVLSFYRELDLGTQGPETWPPNTPGNLVFLSARPHLYKDVSEKHSFAKFQKLSERGMHTMPSLLAGDMASGSAFILTDDMEPLAIKKFNNFQKYVAIYPEFKHVFVGDNGQGDLKAGELMYDYLPRHLEALYIHIVQDLAKTHGYAPDRWRKKGFRPCFFRTYPDAAIDAATRKPPLIRMSGLRRICEDAVRDFLLIQPKQWPSPEHLYARREELNQGIWRANQVLLANFLEPVALILVDQIWKVGQKVRTPYGIGTILSFNPMFDMYDVDLDWRPLDIQIAEHKVYETKIKSEVERATSKSKRKSESLTVLETVVETPEIDEDLCDRTLTLDTESAAASTSNGAPRLVTPTKWESKEHATKEYFLSMEGHHEVENQNLDNRTSSTCLTTPPSTPTEASSEFGSCSSVTLSPSSSLETLQPTASSNESTSEVFNKSPLTDLKGSLNYGNKRNEKCDKQPRHYPKGSDANPNERRVLATIQGRYIKKYSPPKLPVFPKEGEKRGSRFSFWTIDQKEKEAKKPILSVGQQVSTPYGLAIVKEDRASDIVVVKMHGFNATGYLNRASVRVEGKNFINVLLRQLSLKDNQEPQTPKKKKLEPPIAVGTILRTPFGEGVVRPLLLPEDALERRPSERKVASKTYSPATTKVDRGKPSPTIKKKDRQTVEPVGTVAITLSSWVLSDGRLVSHIDAFFVNFLHETFS